MVKCKVGPDGDNNITVRWKGAPVASKGLSNQALDPVPSHSVAGLTMHTNPQTIPRQSIGKDNDRKTTPVKSTAGSIYALKLPVGAKEMRLRESRPFQ
jgi:hypothetical protein